VPPFCVDHINFRPRRRQKYALMVPVRSTKRQESRLAGQMLKRCGGVDQAPIEEYPAILAGGCRSIGQGQRDGAPRKGSRIDPRESRAFCFQLFTDNAPARLLDDGVAASTELGKQSGLAAARAPGDYDKPIRTVLAAHVESEYLRRGLWRRAPSPASLRSAPSPAVRERGFTRPTFEPLSRSAEEGDPARRAGWVRATFVNGVTPLDFMAGASQKVLKRGGPRPKRPSRDDAHRLDFSGKRAGTVAPRLLRVVCSQTRLSALRTKAGAIPRSPRRRSGNAAGPRRDGRPHRSAAGSESCAAAALHRGRSPDTGR
jgi:hypothetical protein